MLLCRMVHDTDIVELELKSKKFSLSMKKKEAVERPEPIYQMVSFMVLEWSRGGDTSLHYLLIYCEFCMWALNMQNYIGVTLHS